MHWQFSRLLIPPVPRQLISTVKISLILIKTQFLIFIESSLSPNTLFKIVTYFLLGFLLNKSGKIPIGIKALLGVAGALMLIGSLGPWESLGDVGYHALDSWQGNLSYIGSFLTIFAATVSFRLYRLKILQRNRPYTDGFLGAVGSVLVLVGGLSFLSRNSSEMSFAWGLYLAIAAGLFGIFSSYMVYRLGSPSIPKGKSKEGI